MNIAIHSSYVYAYVAMMYAFSSMDKTEHDFCLAVLYDLLQEGWLH